VHVQRWAAGLAARGYEVRVVSLGGEPLAGVDSVVIPRRGRISYFTSCSGAVKAARAFRPDLVHVHSAAAFGWWGLRTGQRPMVVSVWGSDVVDFPSNPWRRAYLRRLLRRADAVTATSQFLFEAVGKVCCDIADRVQVIPFGVDIPAKAVPLPEGTLQLCSIKSHKPVYGLDTALLAMSEVVKVLPDARLTIAGGGPMTPALKVLAERLGIRQNTTFVGVLTSEQVYSLLESSHIMLMPSLRESFGVAALEASARGRAVVAGRTGGIPEVVKDGLSGLLVPPGDARALAAAIIKLGRDRAAMYRMGEAGRRHVLEHYAWTRSLDSMTSLYEKLLNG